MKSIVIKGSDVIIVKDNGTQVCASLVEHRDSELLIVFSQKLIRISKTENGYDTKVIKEGVILR